ncbi:MAG: hypothetical protein L0H23_06640 [Luteimonas sp.]|nr:hypothetical protein [Luteimonas sp.]
MKITAVQSVKLFILQLTGLSRDALHIYAGMLVFLLATAFTRKSPRSFVPLLAVFFIAVGMEALDAWDDLHTFGYWRIGASLHDIINTVFWPTVVFLLVRYTKLFANNRAGAA